jgi:hypothetical protein
MHILVVSTSPGKQKKIPLSDEMKRANRTWPQGPTANKGPVFQTMPICHCWDYAY